MKRLMVKSVLCFSFLMNSQVFAQASTEDVIHRSMDMSLDNPDYEKLYGLLEMKMEELKEEKIQLLATKQILEQELGKMDYQVNGGLICGKESALTVSFAAVLLSGYYLYSRLSAVSLDFSGGSSNKVLKVLKTRNPALYTHMEKVFAKLESISNRRFALTGGLIIFGIGNSMLYSGSGFEVGLGCDDVLSLVGILKNYERDLNKTNRLINARINELKTEEQ